MGWFNHQLEMQRFLSVSWFKALRNWLILSETCLRLQVHWRVWHNHQRRTPGKIYGWNLTIRAPWKRRTIKNQNHNFQFPMLIWGGCKKADLCVFSFLGAIWHPQSDPRVQLEIPLFLRISLLWRVALFIRTLGEKGWSWGVFLWWVVGIYYRWWVQKFVSFSTSLSMKPYGKTKTTTYSRNIKWLAGVLNHQQVFQAGHESLPMIPISV